MTERKGNLFFRIVFIVAALFFVGLSVFSYIRVSNLIDASAWVTHTHEVKLELEQSFTALVEAESAQRGYIHSRDSNFLTNYFKALDKVDAHLTTIQSFSQNNASQQQNAKELRALVNERLGYLKSILEEPPHTVITPQRWMLGKKAMDRVRLQIEKMQREEDRLMNQRSSILNRESLITPLFTIVLIIGVVCILGAAYFKIIHELKVSDSLKRTVEERESRLVEAQQLAHIGSWEWDVVNNKIQWSDELYRIYGLTPQQFEADYENFLKYIHADDREFVNGIVQKAFQDQKSFSFIHRLVRSDNSERIVSSTGKVTTDRNGKTIRMAGTAQDVTEQKKYEAELQISEERFIKIFDNNPVAMTLSEIKTNKIRYANHAFCSLFGYSKEEVIGSSSEELNLIAPEENARLIGVIMNILQESRSIEELRALSIEETEELLIKLKQSDAMKNLEVQYTTKKWGSFSALVSFEVLAFKSERFTVTSYQDITDRKRTEVLLKKQNQELGMMNKELESFNYISSHDLQEPLRKIQTFVSRILYEEEKNLSERGKEYFARMQDSANRMQTLIADLLAYSRTSKSEKKLEYAGLNGIIREVQEELNEIIVEKHAIITVDELGYAHVIPFQFRQLIQNLIGNALKFSKPNIYPQIVIRRRDVKHDDVKDVNLSPEKVYCHISISDNGIGFDAKYKDQIFELFRRLHDKQKIAGTGIGLAIVKKIVENHHGVITATGEVNKGANFDIYFPMA